jgi:transcriptional regulator with XRE-family HTH domain
MPTKAQHHRHYRQVPSFLRALREEAGLTQRALGELLKRPQSWVYSCEAGIRRVDVGEFCQWCEACDIDPLSGFKRFLGLR